MSFCTFSDDAAMFDATPIENMFIHEYMYDAPGAALKVYLYARMLALHPEVGGSLAEMAKALRLSEDEIRRAFDYWETRDLIYRLSDEPTYAFKPLRAPDSAATALDLEMYANREFNYRLNKLFGDQFIDARELRKAGDWLNLLHFDADAVLKLVEYGIATSRSKSPKPPSVFKRMDKLAEEWSARGIRTLEQVERAIAEENGVMRTAKQTLKKLGLPRSPSDPELELVTKWVRDWGYSEQEILEACDVTVSGRNPSIGYLDTILDNRRQQGAEVYPALSAVLKELNPRSAQPTPDQIERYKALLAQGFAPELIRLAAIQCHRANKERFDDLEWRLSVWRKDGVSTPEEAEAYMRRMTVLSKQLREVFRQAGSDRRPSYGELETYRAWRDRYPEDLILYAAECSKNAGGSMAYMEKLLKQWEKDGATTLEAAKAKHDAWRASAAPSKAPNPALDYAQRDSSGDDDFFVDLSLYGEEDRK